MMDLIFGRFKPLENKGVLFAVVAGAVLLVARVLLAMPFWKSGLTRWENLPFGYLTQLSGSTTYLFENLFQLNFFWGAMPIPFPALTAYLTGVFEIILPILLVLGLLSRFASLGLLAMSIVIQLVFPEALINLVDPLNSHLLWIALAALLTWAGPGLFSLDRAKSWKMILSPSAKAA